MLRYYIMADLGKTLNELFELNEDEKFYKDYFEVSASSGQLKKFLDKVDLDDAIRRHLIIPELLPDIISYEMNDDEYFKDNDRNVFISKHNGTRLRFYTSTTFLRLSLYLPDIAHRLSPRPEKILPKGI